MAVQRERLLRLVASRRVIAARRKAEVGMVNGRYCTRLGGLCFICRRLRDVTEIFFPLSCGSSLLNSRESM